MVDIKFSLLKVIFIVLVWDKLSCFVFMLKLLVCVRLFFFSMLWIEEVIKVFFICCVFYLGCICFSNVVVLVIWGDVMEVLFLNEKFLLIWFGVFGDLLEKICILGVVMFGFKKFGLLLGLWELKLFIIFVKLLE